MEISIQGKCMTVFLDGEIDHHTAAPIRKQIDGEIDRLKPKLLVLDFGGVTFMDSSGVGLVMGRTAALRPAAARSRQSICRRGSIRS